MSMNLYQIKNIRFRYPGGNRDILNDVTMSINEGEILSVLGPNGAGKSTLLDCMANLSNPQSGEILLAGQEISSMKLNEIASIAGYVPQNHTPTFGYTVMNFVLMGFAPHLGIFGRPSKNDIEEAQQILDELGILDLKDKPYTQISGGERQQAMIARAICQKPRIILFDEPTAHLDYGNQNRILMRIKELTKNGYSAVITTHNPDHALLLGGRAAVLSSDGTLISGNTNDVVTEEAMQELYKTDLKIEYIKEAGRIYCIPPKLQ